MNIKEMRDTDPGSVDRNELAEISQVKIPPRITGADRKAEYLRQIRNPYCYMDGKTLVKISFSGTRKSLQDCVYDYLNWR